MKTDFDFELKKFDEDESKILIIPNISAVINNKRYSCNTTLLLLAYRHGKRNAFKEIKDLNGSINGNFHSSVKYNIIRDFFKENLKKYNELVGSKKRKAKIKNV